MKFGHADHLLTGVAVPVSALRSSNSCGIGEFRDLELLASWCDKTEIELIQILPVNDTGDDSSPYGAQSATALHPIYVRLTEIEGSKPFHSEIAAFQKEYEARPRLDYHSVLSFKRTILERVFDENREKITADASLRQWIEDNTWVKPYAVYNVLKKRYQRAPWHQWPDHVDATDKEIALLWEANLDEAVFHAWVQYHLEQQLSDVARNLSSKGIYLKGDIPILMNVDSVDVWAYRPFFDLGYRAGAPPDMFSKFGQNWGFPVYDWETLKDHDYWWWKLRLQQADKYYHVYRIDHVLGFFRIWRVPAADETGLLGHFDPFLFIPGSKLQAAGLDAGAIRWLSVPHVTHDALLVELDGHADRVQQDYLEQLPGEPLFNLRPEFHAERTINQLEEPDLVKQFLLRMHRERTLIPMGDDLYFPFWEYYDRQDFQQLPRTKREALRNIIKSHYRSSEKVWADRGRELLRTMQQATQMLVCAEDLGAVPDCVPIVLGELNILGLKINRWTRRWDEPGQPYIPLEEYSYLSVCTPSVHDTSTIRGWWEEDDLDRELYCRLIGWEGSPPERMTTGLARSVIHANLDSASLIAIFQIQDWFAISEELRVDDPEEERINTPGTLSDRNWTYRIQLTLEELLSQEPFNSEVKNLVQARRRRPTRFSQ